MPTAAAEVFGLPELMEAILLFIDCKQLFAVDREYAVKRLFALERVSREFQTALRTSKKLRRIVFLNPALPGDPKAKGRSGINPLLLQYNWHLPACKAHLWDVQWEMWDVAKVPGSTHLRRKLYDSSWEDSECRAINLTSDSSCRRMLLTTDPSELRVTICRDNPRELTTFTTTTLGQLADELFSLYSERDD